MSAKAIYESKAKELLFKYVKSSSLSRPSSVVIDSESNWQELEEKNAWLTSEVSYDFKMLCVVAVNFSCYSPFVLF